MICKGEVDVLQAHISDIQGLGVQKTGLYT